MSEPRLCCNCLHCARWRKKDGIECHCDLNDKYLGYLQVMDEENDCKHWEKETKWDLQRKHDEKIRADAIDEFVTNIKIKYLGVHPDELYEEYYPKEIVKEIEKIAEQLKEQNK